MNQKLFQQKGQSLLEVIVVIGVVLVLVTGLLVATTSSLQAVRYAKEKSQGVKYAQEAIEITRNLRNSGWAAFQVRSGVWCLNSTDAWVQSLDTTCPYEINNLFSRAVLFAWNDQVVPQRMEITVTISWLDGTVVHNTKLETYFYKWE